MRSVRRAGVDSVGRIVRVGPSQAQSGPGGIVQLCIVAIVLGVTGVVMMILLAGPSVLAALGIVVAIAAVGMFTVKTRAGRNALGRDLQQPPALW